MLAKRSARIAPLLLLQLLTIISGCVEEEIPSFPVLTGAYLGQEPSGDEPALFAPGIVSTELYVRDVALTPG